MNKRSSFYAGLGFGVLMGIWYLAQNLFLMEDLGTTTILKSLGGALIGGLVSGLLFGALIYWWGKVLNKSCQITLQPGETIQFQTGANHFRGLEGVGGKLYLTDQRLIFQSHKINIQRHNWSLDLAEIQDVQRYKNLGFVDNGLLITTRSNAMEKFVVEKAGEWIHVLHFRKNKINQSIP